MNRIHDSQNYTLWCCQENKLKHSKTALGITFTLYSVSWGLSLMLQEETTSIATTSRKDIQILVSKLSLSLNGCCCSSINCRSYSYCPFMVTQFWLLWLGVTERLLLLSTNTVNQLICWLWCRNSLAWLPTLYTALVVHCLVKQMCSSIIFLFAAKSHRYWNSVLLYGAIWCTMFNPQYFVSSFLICNWLFPNDGSISVYLQIKRCNCLEFHH